VPKPSPVKRLRYRLEAAAFSALTCTCRVLPLSWMVAVGRGLGTLGYFLDRKRRRVALNNLQLAFGDELSSADRHRIARGVYGHLGKFTLEYLALLARPALRPYQRWIDVDFSNMTELLKKHPCVIFVTCHAGHWELLGAATAEEIGPVWAVMKPLRNPLLNERLMALRKRLGMPVILQRHAVRGLVRQLRNGRSVALLTDQNQKRRPMFVDFFGVPAASVATASVLAVRLQLPLVVGYCFSKGPALRYQGIFEPALYPDPKAPPEEEVRRLTQATHKLFERFVRAHPDQWNWIHPRWRTRPEPQDENTAKVISEQEA
jgi:KDO2-lipid IV(A) lauroyltransferase